MKIILVPDAANPQDSTIGIHSATAERCRESAALWMRGGFDAVICSGPAAPLMKEWLARHGVLAERMIAEGRALDTYTNIQYSLEVLEEFNSGKVEITVVSHWTQLPRIWVTFRWGYGTRVKLHRARYQVSWRTVLREFAATVYHCLDRRGTGLVARRNRARRSALRAAAQQ